jgi:hypothetical protein
MHSTRIRLEEERKVKSQEGLRFEVCDCNCVGYEECCLMCCGMAQCGRSGQTFQRNLPPALSVYMKINEAERSSKTSVGFYQTTQPNITEHLNLTFIGPCIVIYSYNTTNKMHLLSQIIYSCKTLYMFRTVFPLIIRSSKLRIQQRYVKQLLLPGAITAGSRYNSR